MKIAVPLNVEVSRRRFYVSIPNPSLETCLKLLFCYLVVALGDFAVYGKLVNTRITGRFRKVTINGFDVFGSLNRIHSAQSVSNQQ